MLVEGVAPLFSWSFNYLLSLDASFNIFWSSAVEPTNRALFVTLVGVIFSSSFVTLFSFAEVPSVCQWRQKRF